MYRIDNRFAATNPPTPTPAGTPGYFTEGDITTGQSPTIVTADWANAVQEELMNILSKGGITPDKTNTAQVLQALSALFTGAFQNVAITQSLLVPPWATHVSFRLVGAGGGGAHCQTTGTNYRSGGGAGSGGYSEAQRPVTPGELLTATVGVGGGAETKGGMTSLAFPGQWSVTGDGGEPGLWDAPNNSHGGAGGVAVNGDLNSLGSWGGDGQAVGQTSVAATGYGGPGFWGGGVRAGQGSPGAGGAGPGAGGGGTYDNLDSNNYYPGGPGANGLIQYRFLP